MRPLLPPHPTDVAGNFRRQTLEKNLDAALQALPSASPSESFFQCIMTTQNALATYTDLQGHPIPEMTITAEDVLSLVQMRLAKHPQHTDLALSLLEAAREIFPEDLTLPLYECRLRYQLVEKPENLDQKDSDGFTASEKFTTIHTDLIGLLSRFAKKDEEDPLPDTLLPHYAEAFLLEADLQKTLGAQGPSFYTQEAALLAAANLFAELSQPTLEADCYDRVATLNAEKGDFTQAATDWLQAYDCDPTMPRYQICAALCALHVSPPNLPEFFERLNSVIADEAEKGTTPLPADHPDMMMAMLLRKKLAERDPSLLDAYEQDFAELKGSKRIGQAFEVLLEPPAKGGKAAQDEAVDFFAESIDQQLGALTQEIQAVKGYPRPMTLTDVRTLCGKIANRHDGPQKS